MNKKIRFKRKRVPRHIYILKKTKYTVQKISIITSVTMTESPLKKFNSIVQDCLGHFKKIFGESDSDIRCMEGALTLVKINVRLFMTPFQQYISNNPDFVHNIMEMNTTYFIGYDFEQLLAKEQLLDEYSKKLIVKFREATIARQDDIKTINAIFNWFKVMMYYAFLDQGKDPKEEIARISDMVHEKNRSKSIT